MNTAIIYYGLVGSCVLLCFFGCSEGADDQLGASPNENKREKSRQIDTGDNRINKSGVVRLGSPGDPWVLENSRVIEIQDMVDTVDNVKTRVWNSDGTYFVVSGLVRHKEHESPILIAYDAKRSTAIAIVSPILQDNIRTLQWISNTFLIVGADVISASEGSKVVYQKRIEMLIDFEERMIIWILEQ